MLSKEDLGRYLRQLRESKGLSLREVDRLSDISYTHLNMIENGKRNVTPALLRNLAQLYNVNYLDLYEKAGYIDLIEDEKNIKTDILGNPVVPIPLVGTVKAGYNYLASENIIGYVSIDKQLSDPDNYFALKVIGDSMQPVLFEDDIVIVHKQSDIESGQVGIILIDGEEATIKKIIKHEDHIELIAFNSYYPIKKLTKDIDFKIIGKVTEARISKIFE